MRIAFSGSHRVGKSTLVEEIADALPRYATVEEPYYLLEEDGYECGDPPSREDFEAQLERSLDALEEGQPKVLFDRCPADVLAYLLTHEDAASFDPEEWLERTRDAMQTLDLVVFVPIEEVDRIPVPSHEDRELRSAVDDKLRELLLDDSLGFEADVLTVHGDARTRAAQVLSRLEVGERGRKKRPPAR
ncbi:MAG: ATP-binding protein [Labilithrix sp.]|nr:ATP-binding protein [Labilithrix sp.]MBX3222768.1 ATP-binding protein [Labilithrix sp.]